MITVNESPSFEKMLRRNRDEHRPIPSGCTESEIDALCTSVKATFKLDLPEGYLDFLRRIDGYSDDVTLYASRSKVIKINDDNRYGIGGVIDMNETDHLFLPEMLVLGELDETLLAWDTIKKRYQTTDRSYINIYDIYPTFWAMVEEATYPLVNDPAEDEDEPM